MGENIKQLRPAPAAVGAQDGVLLAGEPSLPGHAALMGIREPRSSSRKRCCSDLRSALIQLDREHAPGRPVRPLLEKWQAVRRADVHEPVVADEGDPRARPPRSVNGDAAAVAVEVNIPAVQQALAAGKIGISDCYAISKLPETEQAGLLASSSGGIAGTKSSKLVVRPATAVRRRARWIASRSRCRRGRCRSAATNCPWPSL